MTEFERERLVREGHPLESGCIQRISRARVNAGYDVNSFDGSSNDLKYDRFIEVKGSGKATVRFIWTPNEMQKASMLGDRYWIYFVGGIVRRKRLVTHEPVMIQNPLKSLEHDSRLKSTPNGHIIVEGNISGKPLQPGKRVRS